MSWKKKHHKKTNQDRRLVNNKLSSPWALPFSDEPSILFLDHWSTLHIRVRTEVCCRWWTHVRGNRYLGHAVREMMPSVEDFLKSEETHRRSFTISHTMLYIFVGKQHDGEMITGFIWERVDLLHKAYNRVRRPRLSTISPTRYDAISWSWIRLRHLGLVTRLGSTSRCLRRHDASSTARLRRCNAALRRDIPTTSGQYLRQLPSSFGVWWSCLTFTDGVQRIFNNGNGLITNSYWLNINNSNTRWQVISCSTKKYGKYSCRMSGLEPDSLTKRIWKSYQTYKSPVF